MDESEKQIVSDRLLISKLLAEQGANFTGGLLAGENWAKETASAHELETLHNIFAIRAESFTQFCAWLAHQPQGPTRSDHIFRAFCLDEQRDSPEAIQQFWRNVSNWLSREHGLTVQINDFALLWAFVRSALSVWNQVLPELTERAQTIPRPN